MYASYDNGRTKGRPIHVGITIIIIIIIIISWAVKRLRNYYIEGACVRACNAISPYCSNILHRGLNRRIPRGEYDTYGQIMAMNGKIWLNKGN